MTALHRRRKCQSEEEFAVFRPQPRGDNIKISRDGDVFVIEYNSLERIIEGTDVANAEAKRQLIGLLNRRKSESAGQSRQLGIKCARQFGGVVTA